MSKAEYALLQDVIMDADFPDLDLALRRGRHVDRDDAAWYSLLTDAQELLEPFYRRYGCELIHKTDGYFYLLPTGEKVSRKQLSATDMLVGQALALLYLDPAAVERGGVVSQEEIVGQLSAVLGSDALIGLFSPGKRKKQDERIAQRNVRQRVAEAVRRLAGLGFVELNEASAVRLRAALLRFAEPVRGLSEPAEALAKLVAQGEVALTPEGSGEESDESDEAEDAVDEEDAGEESSQPELVASRGAEVADHPDWDQLVQSVAAAESGKEQQGDAVAGSDVSPGDVDHAAADSGVGAADSSSVGPEVVDASSAAVHGAGAGAGDVAALSVADAAVSGDEGEPVSSGVREELVAREELGVRDTDESASGDAWDEASESGVVARPDAEVAADQHEGAGAPQLEKPDSPPARRVTPATDEDLDWADILLPGQDAEDGS